MILTLLLPLGSIAPICELPDEVPRPAVVPVLAALELPVRATTGDLPKTLLGRGLSLLNVRRGPAHPPSFSPIQQGLKKAGNAKTLRS